MYCAKNPKGRTNFQAPGGVLCVSAALLQLLVFGVNALAQEIDNKAHANYSQASSANTVQPPTIMINGLAKRVISFTPPAWNSVGPPLTHVRISSLDFGDSSSPVGTAIESKVEHVAQSRLIESSVVSLPPPRSSRVVELNAPIKKAAAPQIRSLLPPGVRTGSDVGSGLTQVFSLNPPEAPTLPIESWSHPSALVARAHDVLANPSSFHRHRKDGSKSGNP